MLSDFQPEVTGVSILASSEMSLEVLLGLKKTKCSPSLLSVPGANKERASQLTVTAESLRQGAILNRFYENVNRTMTSLKNMRLTFLGHVSLNGTGHIRASSCRVAVDNTSVALASSPWVSSTQGLLILGNNIETDGPCHSKASFFLNYDGHLAGGIYGNTFICFWFLRHLGRLPAAATAIAGQQAL